MNVTVINPDGTEVRHEETWQDKLKTKLSTVVKRAKELGQKLIDWAVNHKKEALAVVSLLAMLAKKLIKPAGVRHQQQERHRIDHTYYDPSTGIHWELRRRPTNTERTILAERKRAGEPAEVILDDLGLLK